MKIETLCDFWVGYLVECKGKGAAASGSLAAVLGAAGAQRPRGALPLFVVIIRFPPNCRTGMPFLRVTMRVAVNGPRISAIGAPSLSKIGLSGPSRAGARAAVWRK